MTMVVHNMRLGSARRMALLLVPVALVPLAAMGVTTRPALEYRELQRAVEDARERADTARRLRSEVGPTDSVEARIEDLRAVDAELGSLIPAELSKVAVYSFVRSAAKRAGLETRSVRVEDAVQFGPVLDGFAVAERSVSVKCSGGMGHLLAFIDTLRAFGFPVATSRYSLVRDPRNNDFNVELELDVYHYAPLESLAGAAPTNADTEGGPIPQPGS